MYMYYAHVYDCIIHVHSILYMYMYMYMTIFAKIERPLFTNVTRSKRAHCYSIHINSY